MGMDATPIKTCDHALLLLTLMEQVRSILVHEFTAACRVLSWVDQPTIVPGFIVRVEADEIVVRYLQSSKGSQSVRRHQTYTMLQLYRRALIAAGWQVMFVDEQHKTPRLHCRL